MIVKHAMVIQNTHTNTHSFYLCKICTKIDTISCQHYKWAFNYSLVCSQQNINRRTKL